MFRNCNKATKAAIIFLGVCPLFGSAQDQRLSEAAIYFRCVAHFANSRPAANDSRLAQVKANQKSAVDACMEVLALANLGQNGRIQGLGGNEEQLSLRVIKTIHDFHRSWFASDNFRTVNDSNSNWPEFDVYNPRESALHLTYVQFRENEPLRNAITQARSFDGIRRSDTRTRYPRLSEPSSNVTWGRDNYFMGPERSNGSFDEWFPRFLPFGELIGIGPIRRNVVEKNLINTSNWNEDIHRVHDAAGLLATTPYFILNWGRGKRNERSNGGNRVARRLANNLFSEVMCRTQPLVRPEDVVDSVQENSSLGFRKGVACMQCHESMDGLAYGYRNYTVGEVSDASNATEGNSIVVKHVFRPTRPAITQLVDNDPEFYLRVPTALVKYRNFDGRLVNRVVRGPAGIGEALADEEAFYVCVAKRYVKFFYSVDANIEDIGYFRGRLTQKDLEYRNFVIQLGRNLKNHQSLNRLVREIISADYYKLNDYGAQ